MSAGDKRGPADERVCDVLGCSLPFCMHSTWYGGTWVILFSQVLASRPHLCVCL